MCSNALGLEHVILGNEYEFFAKRKRIFDFEEGDDSVDDDDKEILRGKYREPAYEPLCPNAVGFASMAVVCGVLARITPRDSSTAPSFGGTIEAYGFYSDGVHAARCAARLGLIGISGISGLSCLVQVKIAWTSLEWSKCRLLRWAQKRTAMSCLSTWLFAARLKLALELTLDRRQLACSTNEEVQKVVRKTRDHTKRVAAWVTFREGPDENGELVSAYHRAARWAEQCAPEPSCVLVCIVYVEMPRCALRSAPCAMRHAP